MLGNVDSKELFCVEKQEKASFQQSSVIRFLIGEMKMCSRLFWRRKCSKQTGFRAVEKLSNMKGVRS
jgi:hypothetical protein